MKVSAAGAASTADPAGEFPLDLATYVFHLFTVVGRHRDQSLEAALRPLGVSLRAHRSLSLIASLEPCTMTELAEFTATDRTTLTRTVDSLVAAGHVVRAVHPSDRRQVALTLTDEGRSACRRSLQAIFRVNRAVLADLEDGERRGLARALERLLGALVSDPGLRQRVALRDARFRPEGLQREDGASE
ncbi:MAG: MarR family winged helix-turn-helix transcriptional regulator [Caulobacteraceae bacterium]